MSRAYLGRLATFILFIALMLHSLLVLCAFISNFVAMIIASTESAQHSTINYMESYLVIFVASAFVPVQVSILFIWFRSPIENLLAPPRLDGARLIGTTVIRSLLTYKLVTDFTLCFSAFVTAYETTDVAIYLAVDGLIKVGICLLGIWVAPTFMGWICRQFETGRMWYSVLWCKFLGRYSDDLE